MWWEPTLAAARPFLSTLGSVLGFAGVGVAAAGVLLEVGPAAIGRPKERPKN